MVTKKIRESNVGPATYAAHVNGESAIHYHMRATMNAISCVDGRAVRECAALVPIVSEHGLMRRRILVILQNLRLLAGSCPGVRELTVDERAALQGWLGELPEWVIARAHEIDGEIHHDMKACELATQELLRTHGSLAGMSQFAYLFMTSEDASNVAQCVMLCESVDVLMARLFEFGDVLCAWTRIFADVSAPALTHGQPASPTTFGKKCGEMLWRICDCVTGMRELRLSAKFSGAIGNYSAPCAVVGTRVWDPVAHGRAVVGAFGLALQALAHQRNNHMGHIRVMQQLKLLASVLWDICDNVWLWIGRDWLRQRVITHEVGSSAMPHKVNPWRLESPQGYLEMAMCMADGMCRGLVESRYERDLSDHPWLRTEGEVIGWMMAALGYMIGALARCDVNVDVLARELSAHPEVTSEALQAAARLCSDGTSDVYGAIKDSVRGGSSVNDCAESVLGDLALRARVEALTPSTYVGLAPELARSAADVWDALPRGGGYLRTGRY